MEKLDGGFIRGFTAGLQKSKEIVGYICNDMRWHKRRITAKELEKALDCAIENREELRENPDAFVRCCKDGYEVFDSFLKKLVSAQNAR